VTVGGETHPLAPPFIVLATQNPIEYEGTFPLPEAQLDRFLMRLSIGYPSREAEIEVLQRRRERRADDIVLSAATSGEELLAMRSAAEEVFVERDLEGYMVDLVSRTRADPNVYVGASPRGALALLKLARARAALDGRAYTLPDDVKEFAVPALAHRLILSPELWSKRITPARVVEGILGLLPVPKAD